MFPIPLPSIPPSSPPLCFQRLRVSNTADRRKGDQDVHEPLPAPGRGRTSVLRRGQAVDVELKLIAKMEAEQSVGDSGTGNTQGRGGEEAQTRTSELPHSSPELGASSSLSPPQGNSACSPPVSTSASGPPPHESGVPHAVPRSTSVASFSSNFIRTQ